MARRKMRRRRRRRKNKKKKEKNECETARRNLQYFPCLRQY
jgi:hypothetical protein